MQTTKTNNQKKKELLVPVQLIPLQWIAKEIKHQIMEAGSLQKHTKATICNEDNNQIYNTHLIALANKHKHC